MPILVIPGSITILEGTEPHGAKLELYPPEKSVMFPVPWMVSKLFSSSVQNKFSPQVPLSTVWPNAADSLNANNTAHAIVKRINLKLLFMMLFLSSEATIEIFKALEMFGWYAVVPTSRDFFMLFPPNN